MVIMIFDAINHVIQSCRYAPKMLPMLIALVGLIASALACSAESIVGPQQANLTPTFVPFATATAGGRVSVWLITPTGAANAPSPTAAPFGSLIAPVASATAAFATLQAATFAAGATFSAPLFQPTECPTPGNPLPPLRPAQFSQYPQTIGLYLSQGGETTTLESTLRAWGALIEGRGVLQTNADLTGNGVNNIIITLIDPQAYRPNQPAPGQLLVYGCAQKGYRLLYSTAFTPETMLPELKRVGNMNGNAQTQLVFTQQLCANNNCTQTLQIMAWNAVTGAFAPLNNVPIDTTNARISIADIDGDGILEVTITFTPPDDVAAGPPRRYSNIWDWDGVSYVLAQVRQDAPIYRIHALYDADSAFEQGDFRNVLKLYDRVRDDQYLQPWLDPNELTTLRAYALYRKLLAYAALKSGGKAAEMLTQLQAENPAGSIGDGWSQAAGAFMTAYNKSHVLKKVCAATLDFLNTRSDLISTLNGYGYANHAYTAQELCPF